MSPQRAQTRSLLRLTIEGHPGADAPTNLIPVTRVDFASIKIQDSKRRSFWRPFDPRYQFDRATNASRVGMHLAENGRRAVEELNPIAHASSYLSCIRVAVSNPISFPVFFATMSATFRQWVGFRPACVAPFGKTTARSRRPRFAVGLIAMLTDEHVRVDIREALSPAQPSQYHRQYHRPSLTRLMAGLCHDGPDGRTLRRRP